MKIVDSAESPGNGSGQSEDRLGHAGKLAWVIDGASDFTGESNLPGLSNVHWLVDFVQSRLMDLGASGTTFGADELIDILASDTRSEMRRFDLEAMHNHPVCSIGLITDKPDCVEIARIGDATVIADDSLEMVEVSTSFFDDREATAVSSARRRGTNKTATLDSMFARRLEYITGVHSESVFSGHPKAVFHVYSKTITRHDRELVTLACTDGFSRAVKEYELFPDWASLLADAHDGSLHQIVSAIREYERSGRERSTGMRFKSSDDIAAILAEFRG